MNTRLLFTLLSTGVLVFPALIPFVVSLCRALRSEVDVCVFDEAEARGRVKRLILFAAKPLWIELAVGALAITILKIIEVNTLNSQPIFQPILALIILGIIALLCCSSISFGLVAKLHIKNARQRMPLPENTESFVLLIAPISTFVFLGVWFSFAGYMATHLSSISQLVVVLLNFMFWSMFVIASYLVLVFPLRVFKRLAKTYAIVE